jgi:NADH-quinone oxidoreductase subunit L
MTVPLMILAFGAFAVGFLLEWTHGLSDLLAKTPSLAFLGSEPHDAALENLHWSIAVKSTALVVVGVAAAALLYTGGRQRLVNRLAAFFDLFGLYRLSYGKFFFDPIYNTFVVWPLHIFALLCGWFDRWALDRLVDGVGAVPKWIGSRLRPLQNGLIQFYALAMMLGILILLMVLFL